ncbi:MAG TPA: ABC transporter ATP-binding protein [Thermoanaerobaculia bacterium]|nr:ABC transporter ATP-binding protein [Thermoanaerobaculia bacterium]
MIEAQELSRRYGTFTAVDRISFSVEEGAIVGILGPNWAGKTTTIRMITGFLPPTGGRVTVAGRDLFVEPRRARRDIGYLPENVALYPEMRVREYLAYRGRLEGLKRAAAKKAVAETIERAMLADVADQIIGTLSKGYRQRVGLAAAILHRPRVLVLDEPTVGLDPKQIVSIRELIRDLGRNATLLLSTHILPEVELLCDRVLVIDRGQIVADGTTRELHERWVGRRGLRVAVRPDGATPEAVAACLGGLPGVAKLQQVQTPYAELAVFRLEVDAGSDPREAVFRCTVQNGWVLYELAEERGSLEDVFVQLTTRDETATSLDGIAIAEPAAAPGEGDAGEPAAESDGEEPS